MKLKSVKEMLKRLCLALFIVSALACQADPRISIVVSESDLKPELQQSVIAKSLVELMENFHYQKVVVDDSFSSIVFDEYLKALDNGKSYFLQSDIADFEKYRLTMDDDLRSGDLSVPFYIFNVYQKRYNDRVAFALKEIDKKFDFTSNESYTYDREKLPWLKSEAESNNLWSKRVKYEMLNLKVTGTDESKIKETLKKRYENLVSQSTKFNNQDVFGIFMNSFTGTVDPHTNYFVPNRAQEFNEDLARTFEGIGARLQLENEVVKIAEIIPGGPAFKAKTLEVNDRIVAVAQGKDGEFVDVIGWRLDVTVTKIKGPKGTIVRLKVIPAGQELSATPKIVELVRDKVVLEDQSAKRTIKTVTQDGKSYKIGIIQIPAFYADFKAMQARDPNYKSTTRDVKLLLDTLKRENVDAVVIDLRSNGGGSLPEAISLSGLFIKSGPIVQVRDRRNNIEIEEDEDPGIAWTGPLGVLQDRFSASASEIFAGAIQDYGRGIIIGNQSYGKGTVQQGIDMGRVIGTADKLMLKAAQTAGNRSGGATVGANAPEFGQINLTMAKFYRVNGSTTQHKGVVPDIELPTVFPKDKYGESSEPRALPWDTIAPSKYSLVANLDDVKRKLLSMHKERMKTSLGYQNLQQDIADFAKREAETTITLNEVQLKKERDDQEAKVLLRENQRRAAKGLPPLKKGEARPKDDVDFIRDEGLQIMADYIKIK
ncbi:MAG: tail-specific protease [Sphingobacteriales bacterium 17-39-43]|uniref:carboxy terminal-processing peptidase n=1 Tax=Daejeonella sp. TaxID=2805397 RepID=UPI000BC567B9|nr:carboxy terminal-processing peptidase [Daejeonella sp.]OYZ32539.1 MAG: tail-specific protease [Sphingobacteriales bacterium 16-39-50]OZA25902.1 MAG: tail-specific protease [Sphingobacteriales bacterium 17-39-43]HQT21898.1 carboxy terminal-processing peptidase [Daejeonella sp.]HQT57205.1 carboxy terminal-processing peptidase [Daejeonella sp.]